jgi:hypothetical protein
VSVAEGLKPSSLLSRGKCSPTVLPLLPKLSLLFHWTQASLYFCATSASLALHDFLLLCQWQRDSNPQPCYHEARVLPLCYHCYPSFLYFFIGLRPLSTSVLPLPALLYMIFSSCVNGRGTQTIILVITRQMFCHHDTATALLYILSAISSPGASSSWSSTIYLVMIRHCHWTYF